MTSLADVDVAAIPRDELPVVLGRLVELEARVRLRLAELPGATGPAETAGDRNLDVEEVARRLGVSARYVYRNGPHWPCARHVGRRLVFSEAGLGRLMAERWRRS